MAFTDEQREQLRIEFEEISIQIQREGAIKDAKRRRAQDAQRRKRRAWFLQEEKARRLRERADEVAENAISSKSKAGSA